MKQVIIRIRDDKNRLVAKNYYFSVSQYEYEAYKFVQNQLLPGMECCIKVGNQYSKYFTYEDCLDDLEIDKYNEDGTKNDINVDDEIYSKVYDRFSLMYYIKEYLPRY